MGNGHHSKTAIAVKDKGVTGVMLQSGPFPSPEVMEALERLNPGSVERVLRMAEREQESFHDFAKKQQSIDFMTANRMTRFPFLGMWLGFILCMASLIIGAALIYLGHEIGGYASLFVSIGVMVKSLLFPPPRPTSK